MYTVLYADTSVVANVRPFGTFGGSVLLPDGTGFGARSVWLGFEGRVLGAKLYPIWM